MCFPMPPTPAIAILIEVMVDWGVSVGIGIAVKETANWMAVTCNDSHKSDTNGGFRLYPSYFWYRGQDLL